MNPEEIMSLRIRGLPAEHFTHLFSLSDDALFELEARRITARRASHYPCRVSLRDAGPGEQLLLVNYEHHAVASPYRARFAIYVRPGDQTYDAIDRVPEQLRSRLLALRAYDECGFLVGCELTSGTELAACSERLFENPSAAYLHAHYAAPGCYAARIERA
jgi:hypothetical protein